MIKIDNIFIIVEVQGATANWLPRTCCSLYAPVQQKEAQTVAAERGGWQFSVFMKTYAFMIDIFDKAVIEEAR